MERPNHPIRAGTMVLAALLTTLAASVWGANTERPTRSVFAGEPALQRRLSFSDRAVRLGEIIDRISALTGVDLEVDDQRVGPVSGLALTTIVHDRPAVETLDAIAALYNYPPDRWYWERIRKCDGTARYLLRHTLASVETLEARESIMRRLLLRQYQKLSALYAASPEQRNRMAASDPMLAAYNVPRGYDFLSFLPLLSQSELNTVLAGESVDISRSRLSAKQLDFITNEYRQANLLGRPRIPQPDDLEKVSVAGAGLNEPTIWLAPGPLGSHGLVGGIWMDAEMKNATLSNWIGVGDSTKASDAVVPAPGVELKRDDLLIQNAKLDRLLRRLGRIGKLNILFDRTSRAAGTSLSADFRLAGRLSELLPRLSKDRLVWKKRSTFLLFRPENWPAESRENLPTWPLIRDLRTAASANGGYLRPQDWIRLGRFERETLKHLEDEFPDAGRQQIGRVEDLMRLASQATERERRLWDRDGGAGWSDLSAKSRATLQELMPRANFRSIRILLQWNPDAKTPSGTFYLGPPEGQGRPIRLLFRKRIGLDEGED